MTKRSGETTVRLGYAVGSGEPVDVPVVHTVVTGQTQLAGKTTALEAMVARSNLRAYAFVTKRGEQSFAGARRIPPYLRERADWQFVQSVLEATMRERMKFERAWIMRASKGAKTLADVQRNVRAALADKKTRGLSADVYMTLDAYLDIVVPRLTTVKFADTLHLAAGLSVVDMADRSRFPSELQALVIRSTIEFIYEVCEDTVAIIPEAWEWLPQSRGSPVKLAAIELIRKGAGLRNFVWLDSQDLGGVDKELLRSCSLWLLGVQREENEVKRTLGNIPAGVAKPKPAEIALLERGQFYACWGRHVVKTYVQPSWMPDQVARAVAVGDETVQWVGGPPPLPDHIDTDPQPERYEDEDEPEETDDMTEDQEKKLDTILSLMESVASAQQARQSAPAPPPDREVGRDGVAREIDERTLGDEDALFERFKARLLRDPKVLAVVAKKPELTVVHEVAKIGTSTETAHGMLALLIAEGFLNDTTKGSEAWRELGRRFGYKGPSIRAYEQLAVLTKQGFLTKEGKEGFRAVPGMKINIDRGANGR